MANSSLRGQRSLMIAGPMMMDLDPVTMSDKQLRDQSRFSP
jgi:hypothetical protein